MSFVILVGAVEQTYANLVTVIIHPINKKILMLFWIKIYINYNLNSFFRNNIDIYFKNISIPVVLDSAILGVLPTNELLPRRVVTHTHPHAHTHAHAHAHQHAHPHEPYPLPVDPLVVNFEEGMRLYWTLTCCGVQSVWYVLVLFWFV